MLDTGYWMLDKESSSHSSQVISYWLSVISYLVFATDPHFAQGYAGQTTDHVMMCDV
jgi:hypothetical protein